MGLLEGRVGEMVQAQCAGAGDGRDGMGAGRVRGYGFRVKGEGRRARRAGAHGSPTTPASGQDDWPLVSTVRAVF
jgi:hypothetical protein